MLNIVDKYKLSKEENIFLAKKMLVSSIYSSAKIEGLNVTFPETQTILDGINVSKVKLDDITCILNLRDAWNYVINNIDEEVNLDFICMVNSFVSRNESLEWGKLRSGKVGISGTSYVSSVPLKEEVEKNIKEIMSIENITLRAIKYMLYGMRSQLFWDGNKRTSTIIANKIMINNGKGIILVQEEYILEFNKLLTEYYNTSNDEKLIEFIYNNCIVGIVN